MDFIDRIAARARQKAMQLNSSATDEPRSLAATCAVNAWIIVVGVAFAYLSSIIGDDDHEFLHDLFQEIGIALMVSYVIIISIEFRSRRELNDFVEDFVYRTHSDFFQLIMGVQFPKRMFEFVRNYLMQERAYRLKTQVHFVIDDVDPQAARQFGIATVTLHMTCKYLIQNLSNRPYDFPIQFFVEKTPGGNETPTVFVDKKELTAEEIREADAARADAPGLHCFEYAMHLDRGQAKEVVVKTNHVRLIADTMVWRSSHSCDGLQVTVTNPRGLCVQLAAIHPETFEYGDRNEVHQAAQINSPLFPANGFMFWWSPTVEIV